MLRGAQIRQFLILHKELDPDDEEITRTRKVRRGYIAQKYAALIEALYSDRDARPGGGEGDLRGRAQRHHPGRRDDPGRGGGGGGGRVTGPAGARPLLEVEAVSVRFGALLALTRVSLEIARGEIVAIIGPNGAGKTTLLNVISGFYRPFEGRIVFDGRDRTHLRPPDVAELGVARTFQNVALFKGMSVLDNIMTGRLLKMRGSFLLDALWWGPARRQELAHRAFVERIIDFLEIQAIRKTPAGTLPYGLQKRVELARALAAEPAAPAARRADGGHERRGEGGHVPLHPRRQQ